VIKVFEIPRLVPDCFNNINNFNSVNNVNNVLAPLPHIKQHHYYLKIHAFLTHVGNKFLHRFYKERAGECPAQTKIPNFLYSSDDVII